MKKTIKTLVVIFLAVITFSCDGNDDAQTTPSTPTDGFTIGTTFYATPNVYVAVDQADANNDGQPDYYSFFFSDGRMTDTFGDNGVGYAYAYSTNTTKLAQVKVLAASNVSLTTAPIAASTTPYIGSSIITPFATGFSVDSFISYNLQPNTTILGAQNGINFTNIPETIGIWHYPGAVGPTITINAINIDYTTPTNSTIDVDYNFIDSAGIQITGHYEGTLGVMLD